MTLLVFSSDKKIGFIGDYQNDLVLVLNSGADPIILIKNWKETSTKMNGKVFSPEKNPVHSNTTLSVEKNASDVIPSVLQNGYTRTSIEWTDDFFANECRLVAFALTFVDFVGPKQRVEITKMIARLTGNKYKVIYDGRGQWTLSSNRDTAYRIYEVDGNLYLVDFIKKKIRLFYENKEQKDEKPKDNQGDTSSSDRQVQATRTTQIQTTVEAPLDADTGSIQNNIVSLTASTPLITYEQLKKVEPVFFPELELDLAEETTDSPNIEGINHFVNDRVEVDPLTLKPTGTGSSFMALVKKALI